jgi:hypothetical protein
MQRPIVYRRFMTQHDIGASMAHNPEGIVDGTSTERAVWAAMPPGEWINASEAADRADKPYSTVHGALQRLVEEGHVEKQDHGGHAVIYYRPEGADGP